MKTLQELADEGFFTTTAEPELIKEQLFATIKDASQKNAIGRQLVEVVPLRNGSSLNFELADKDSMIVGRVGETAEIPLTRETYTEIIVTPRKYGGVVKISKEMIEDSNFELIERNLRQAGREMANTETQKVFDAFNDTTLGFPKNGDHDITSAGTEFGIIDITNGMQQIEEQDYIPNVMALNPKQVNEIRQIDTFVEADKVGNRNTFEKGFVGKIFSLDSVVSSIQSADVVHILDQTEAGVMVIRRPLTVERWNDPLRDLVAAGFTQRFETVVLRARAGVKITIS